MKRALAAIATIVVTGPILAAVELAVRLELSRDAAAGTSTQ